MNAPRLALSVALLVVAGCASSRTPAAPATSSATPTITSAVASPSARDTHEQLQATLWMQTAIEYRMVCESAYRAATAALDAALVDRAWSAAVEQIGDASALPAAVILDLDETVLNNSRFQGELVRRRLVYTPELWREWVRQRRAELVPGAGAFLVAARERGVAVFFVTNRRIEEEGDTVANLAALGVDAAPETLLCAGENDWPSDKVARRTLLAGTHRIVVLVGDDLGDFIPARVPAAERAPPPRRTRRGGEPAGSSSPQPAYGSWERALLGTRRSPRRAVAADEARAVKGFTDRRGRRRRP